MVCSGHLLASDRPWLAALAVRRGHGDRHPGARSEPGIRAQTILGIERPATLLLAVLLQRLR
jgi:hypothetical protein